MPPPHWTSSWSTSIPSEETKSFRSLWARSDASATLTSAWRSDSSIRKQSATFSSSGTAKGSRSTGVRYEPERASIGASARGRVRPAAAANPQARSAASRAPSGESRRSEANPQAPPTSTRTPIPSLSLSVSVWTRPFFVPTDCERRTAARASA